MPTLTPSYPRFSILDPFRNRTIISKKTLKFRQMTEYSWLYLGHE